jgi:hypothetical protein
LCAQETGTRGAAIQSAKELLSIAQIASLQSLRELLKLRSGLLGCILQNVGLIQCVAGRNRGYRHRFNSLLRADLLNATHLPESSSLPTELKPLIPFEH